MRPDGTQQERLTDNVNLNDLNARYSPDGQYLAYMTNYSVGDGTGEIWIMNADGSDQRRLTDNHLDDLGSVWSPDSQYLAYWVTAADRSGSDLWVMDITTGTAHQLTRIAGHEYAPIWSPDGAWLVFTHTPDGGANSLYVVRADGTALQRLVGGDDIHSVQASGWWLNP